MAYKPSELTFAELKKFLTPQFGDWDDEEEHEITDMRELFEDLPEA